MIYKMLTQKEIQNRPEIKEKLRLANLGNKNPMYGDKNPRYKILKNNYKKLSPNLAYVLGVVKGDASIWEGSLTLGVRDKEFALFFKENLENWAHLKSVYKIRIDKSNNKKEYWISLYSIAVCNFLKNFNIEELKISNNKCKVMFLKGMYDSEGGVDSTTRFITICNNNIFLLELCKDLLKDLGINTTKIYHYKNCGMNYEYEIGRRTDIIKFKNIVGLTIKRKQLKILTLLNSYKIKEGKLKKEDING